MFEIAVFVKYNFFAKIILMNGNHTVRTVNDVLEDRYHFYHKDIYLPKRISISQNVIDGPQSTLYMIQIFCKKCYCPSS